MNLLTLILEWRTRLRGMIPFSTDPASGWLWTIRARILRFLISRYDTVAQVEAPRAFIFKAPPPPPTFCIVTSADGPPPRSGDAIRALLDDIHSCNLRPSRSWWTRIHRARP